MIGNSNLPKDQYGTSAEFYDVSYNRRSDHDVRFFVDCARQTGGRTLEFGCLNYIHRHLAPDGRLVFDVFNPNPIYLVPNPAYANEREDLPETSLPDGRRLRRASRITGFHREEQYNDVELVYYITGPDGQTERTAHSFQMRYFYRYELEHLLDHCDCKILDLYGDFDRSPFGPDSPEIIIVAGKIA